MGKIVFREDLYIVSQSDKLGIGYRGKFTEGQIHAQ